MKKLLVILLGCCLTTLALAQGSQDVYNQARQTEKKEDNTQQIATVVSAAMLAICAATQGSAQWACMMGVSAGMQALQSGGASNGSGYTAGQAFNLDFGNQNNGVAGADSERREELRRGGGLTAGQRRQIEKNLADLATQGYGFDQSTQEVVGPNVRVPVGALGSAGAMSQFLSPDQVAAGTKALEEVQKIADEYSVVAMPTEEGGGGGGAGGGKKAGSGYQPFNMDDYRNKLLAKLNGSPQDAAGKTRNIAGAVDGERIGVAGDNIFAMINRRYEAKSRANYFLP